MQMPSPRLWMLVASAPKVGKTRLCASSVDDERLWPGLLIDVEGGVSSISTRIREVKLADIGKVAPEKGKLDVVRVVEWTDLEPLLTKLTGDMPYKFIAVDSLTELSWANIAHQTGVKKAPYPDQQAYGYAAVDMRGVFRVLRDHVNAHVLFTAQLKEREEGPGGKTVLTAAMVGRETTRDISGVVNLLGLLETEKVGVNQSRNVLYFELHNGFRAGHRVDNPKFPTAIINPTLGGLLTAIGG